MSSLPLPPNPCLIAIILVVKSTKEPFLTFHYPPQPGEDNSHFREIFREDADESTTSSSDTESQNSAAEDLKLNAEEEVQKRDSPPDVEEIGSASPDKSNGFGQNRNKMKWNDLFGYRSVLLARLLSPAASYHKRRFEVGINDNVFLGWPVFARSDGTWKKAKSTRRLSSRSKSTAGKAKRSPKELIAKSNALSTDEDIDSPNPNPEVESRLETDLNGKIRDEQNSSEMPTQGKLDPTKTKAANDANFVPSKNDKPLEMFNVVFVLNPPPLEYHLRTKEMYDNVVKKFGKALRWEQARSNYVAKETKCIDSLTKHMREQSSGKLTLSTLYHDLIAQSSLAKGIATLYNSIASSRIAHVSLTPFSSLSLQIPIPSSISALPTPLEPQLPGLWLTTSNSVPTDDDAQTPQLGSHFTLLLLSDVHSILADVNAAASPITKPLTHYLRVSSPWKSFYQISQSSGIPLSDIQFLASHLIYWRRARAIPPLHHRDIYVVSPNADMRKLASATSTFSKAFPALPPLPKILSLLSSTPKPFVSLMPSKDHKAVYMDILVWLMRECWVTQLRMFAWVRVPPHIKRSVGKDSTSDRLNKPPQHLLGDDSDDASNSILDVPDSSSSSRFGVPCPNPTSPSSSTHTTLPLTLVNSSLSPTLIPNPRLASALPSRYISAISKHVSETQGGESQAAWDKCVKYFDGKHAIETIPVREGWKKKKVASLVAGWEELGVLVKGRHW